MTHSLTFSQVKESTLLRGVNKELLNKLFHSKQSELPKLLLSKAEIARNYLSLKKSLPRADIHYAVKSNNHPAIIDELHKLGSRFEVCSVSEIDQVTKNGVLPNEIVHSHPIKSVTEFDQAVAKGVEVFVVDNFYEVTKLSKYSDRKLKIVIRFKINNSTKAVVDLQYKFGCSLKDVLPLAYEITKQGHEFHGLGFHVGSQCIYSDNYIKAIKAAHDLIHILDMASFNCQMLDIGGGFPVEYIEPIPSIEEFCQPINKALDEHIRPGIKIICEPGRFISASVATLICSVIGKAVRDGKIWYYLDDGLYSTFSGIVYDQCQYPVITNKQGQEKLSVLAGPTCDSFDVIYDSLMIPEHDMGEIFIFPMTGAYCSVSGCDFNSLKRPKYIVTK